MKKKIAFVGFRHVHIMSLYNIIKDDTNCEIVATCEEHQETAKVVNSEWGVKITHNSFEKMLKEVDFDILAIGDYFGIRGERAIAGLKANKHIISDKPLCISLDELAEIKKISSENNLKIGVMLDFRTHRNVLAAKALIASDDLGEIDAIYFGGQHPLNYGNRSAWYFEAGKHGGTINDIVIHGLDAVEFMTEKKITTLVAARTWNAKATEVPFFNDAAQVMLSLENRCGVIADVSYFAPENIEYVNPFYWRFTIWGRKGVLEFNYNEDGCKFYPSNSKEIKNLNPIIIDKNFYEVFMSELAGNEEELGTQYLLKISESCLKLQSMADNN